MIRDCPIPSCERRAVRTFRLDEEFSSIHVHVCRVCDNLWTSSIFGSGSRFAMDERPNDPPSPFTPDELDRLQSRFLGLAIATDLLSLRRPIIDIVEAIEKIRRSTGVETREEGELL